MLMNSNNHAAKENERAARKAALEQAILDEGWTRRKEMVKGGEYVESNVERTVTVSADGRFKIYPSGSMGHIKARGGHRHGWMWLGYALRDAETNKARTAGEELGYQKPITYSHGSTVSGIKRAVARWRLGR